MREFKVLMIVTLKRTKHFNVIFCKIAIYVETIPTELRAVKTFFSHVSSFNAHYIRTSENTVAADRKNDPLLQRGRA